MNIQIYSYKKIPILHGNIDRNKKFVIVKSLHQNTFQKNEDRDILDKYDIFVIGEQIYCCEALEKNLWVKLIEHKNNKNGVNEPKTVLGFANYSGGYSVIGGRNEIKFCPFCGRKIELEKGSCET